MTFNLQATMLFIVTSATKGEGGGYHPPRFRVRLKILYRVIQPLIQHCLVRRAVYSNIIYVIATRNYDFFYYRHCSVINEHLRYSTVTTYVFGKINIKLQVIVSCNTAFDSALFAE